MAVRSLVPYREFTKPSILEQYKRSEKLRGLINAVLDQCDSLEVAFLEILQALNLDDAVGPSLDAIGALAGVDRIPGESDDEYRQRIKVYLNLTDIPAPEALRRVLKFVTGCEFVGLYPNWPAELYYVLYGETSADLSNLETENMTSGASLVHGTLLVGEMDDNGEYECGYIVNEDNGQPLVVDYYYPTTLYEVVDDEGVEILIKDSATEETTEPLLALDY